MRDDGTAILGIYLEWSESFSYLLLQILRDEDWQKRSRGEELKDAEAWLFDEDEQFRRQLQGCFGAFKPIAQGLTVEQAARIFNERYSDRWNGERWKRLSSPTGQRYIVLRLSAYCRGAATSHS